MYLNKYWSNFAAYKRHTVVLMLFKMLEVRLAVQYKLIILSTAEATIFVLKQLSEPFYDLSHNEDYANLHITTGTHK